MPQNNDLPFALVMLVFLAAAGCGLLTLTRQHRDTLRMQMYIFLAALGLRFVLSVIIYDFDLVKILGDEDGSGWYGGVTLMNAWIKRQVGWLDLPVTLAEAFQQQNRGYTYLLGGLF